MKKLIIAALLVFGISTYAQEANQAKKKSGKGSKEMKSPEHSDEAILAKMTTELNLDAKQQAQIKPIIAEQTVKMDAIRAKQKANKDSGVMPTDADKKAMKKTRSADKKATENKIKEILTPDQFVKYQAMQEAQKEKMKAEHKPKSAE